MYRITVPATSANIGPGFDCLGVALDMYNSIEVEEIPFGVKIESSSGNSSYSVENNLIYKAMQVIFEKVGRSPKGLRIIQNDSIPATRGLGSSAACIVGGLLAANAICEEPFTTDDIAFIAASMEGHADNTTPAIFGGMRTSVLTEDRVLHVGISVPEELKFVVIVPEFTLSTTKARMVLPHLISYGDAVHNIGRTALLVASFLNGDLSNLRVALDDKMHQPYRKRFIPDIEKVFEKGYELGAKGCYISGAGPTLVALVDSDYERYMVQMKVFIDSLKTSWSVNMYGINTKGAEVFIK